jgi:hypothetical protein
MKRKQDNSRGPDDTAPNPWEATINVAAIKTIHHPDELPSEAKATSLVAVDSEGAMWSISQSVIASLHQTLEDAPTLTAESMLNAYNRQSPNDRFEAGEGFHDLLDFATSFKAIQALEGNGEVKVMPSRLAEALNARDLARSGTPTK